jgi:O-glycosyl hydrolase
VGSSPVSVAIADLDGDGNNDLAVTNSDSNNVSVLLNTPAAVTEVTATTANGSYKLGDTIASLSALTKQSR